MFSGKTSFLLSYERKSLIAQKKCCYLKFQNDKRYSDTNVVNHDGHINKSTVYNTMYCMDIEKEMEPYDIILIDEGQFYSDLSNFCDTFGTTKTIIISALSGDYKMKMFQPIMDIFGKADKIIHSTAICTSCGEDAPFTKRLFESNEQVLIGGKEMYVPKCRKCY